MRLLFVGDLIGRAGRDIVATLLPDLRRRWSLDCVVVNGENAAGGFGITEVICQNILDAGADCVTLGNHAFDQREALVFIERQPRLIRPINYPPGTPGAGAALIDVGGDRRVLVINAMGRVFMDAMDDPFAAIDRELEACPLGQACDAIIVDFHGEATSEKMAMGHYCDGRASLVVGTHTHVPTADHQILPRGTAYLSDAGMCGDYDSVIGMDKERAGPPHDRARRPVPATNRRLARQRCAASPSRRMATRATPIHVAPVRLGGRLVRSQAGLLGVVRQGLSTLDRCRSQRNGRICLLF